MHILIAQILVTLLAFMQNPSVPPETKIRVANETLPVITKYMDEIKNEEQVPAAGEINTAVEQAQKEAVQNAVEQATPKIQIDNSEGPQSA